jgi:Tol biopolymer transport system component
VTRGRAVLLSVVGALAALVLLLGTATLGLRLRSSGDPAALPDAAPLDYTAAPFGAFSPLSPSFITDVLGGIIALPARREQTAAGGVSGATISRATSLERVDLVHTLTNDDRSRARTIPSVPFTARTDTRRASREAGEPTPCGAVRGGTVWYRYTAPADTGFIANTFGSGYATTLAVFTTTSEPATVGCDTDVRGDAIVQFAALKGVTYLFQITGAAGGGDLVFTLDPEGTTSLISASPSGAPANQGASDPSISPDGRFVVFQSTSTNLVRTATNGAAQIFMRDRRTAAMTLVSVDPTGRAGNGDSFNPSVSADGRHVVFQSRASNLVAGDTNGELDVFVRDVQEGSTKRVSVSSEGAQLRHEQPTEWGDATADRAVKNPETGDNTMFPSLTPDGRHVVFQSRASNLVRGDHNHVIDVFVHDRVTRVTERVSVSSTGRERGPDTSYPPTSSDNEDSMIPSISGSGRFVMFRTSAANLVSGDDNLSHDIFVHDRAEHITRRILAADAPVRVDDRDQPRYAMNEYRPRTTLSFDGRHATFSAAPRPTYGPAEVNIFARDSRSGRTVMVNVSSTGEHPESNSTTRFPSMSLDGRFVAFHSSSSRLVPGTDGSFFNVFVRDLVTRTTIRLTSFTGGDARADASCRSLEPLGCGSLGPAISGRGDVVAFESSVGGGSFLVPANLVQIYANERPLPAR